ncbi:MAG TPA: type I glyceraldehyde-3-phosphate dehydrogenase [Mycobacteriales bacterium]
MTTRVGINGFGRIGKNFFRAVLAGHSDLEIVAANDIGDVPTMAHLLRHDSTAGLLAAEVRADGDTIHVGDRSLKILSERDPAGLPWGDLGVDVVVESTGLFTQADAARAHLAGGAKKVVISAPATGEDATIVMGVNDDVYDGSQTIVSNASCTTNCVAPMAKVLDDAFGIETGFMTTVHAYTADQRLIDLPHRDLRRARAAAVNVIPASTGAARATALVLPHLKGKLDGMALRVPVPVGSITDLVVTLDRDVSRDEVNAAFRAAADGPLKGYLDFTDEPIVSSDIVGSAASCTFDSLLTMAGGRTAKVFGWYDNEWGYSNRLADLVSLVGAKLA